MPKINIQLAKSLVPYHSELLLWHAPEASCGEYRTETIARIHIRDLCQKDILTEILRCAENIKEINEKIR